jgi:hypothetical protein
MLYDVTVALFVCETFLILREVTGDIWKQNAEENIRK